MPAVLTILRLLRVPVKAAASIAQRRAPLARPANSRTLTRLTSAGLLDQRVDLAGLIDPPTGTGQRPGMEMW
jgi:hypothetical protein